MTRLPETPGPAHAEARQFCLDTIKEFYGFGYRPDWHADLDALLRPAAESHYSRQNRGAFWTLRDADGSLVATAGIRHLGWKPNIVALFPGRYERGEEIASLWRLYVRKDRRRHGLGRWFAAVCEREAERLGYGTMYLHANADAQATIAFWESIGYRKLGTWDESTHFDKPIGAAARAA
jgi:GNAT superfamily N-acetyltransferase